MIRNINRAFQKKLNQSQVETIKYLQSRKPEQFSLPVLSRHFGVDYTQLNKITSTNTASLEQLQLRLQLMKTNPLDLNEGKSASDTIRQVESKLARMLSTIEKDFEHNRLNRNQQHSFMSAALVQKKLLN